VSDTIHVFVREVVPQGTISLGFGTDDDGRKVIFGGDWRPMRDIQEGLVHKKHIEVDVPKWAVLVHAAQP
jgi:hypothetical protein